MVEEDDAKRENRRIEEAMALKAQHTLKFNEFLQCAFEEKEKEKERNQTKRSIRYTALHGVAAEKKVDMLARKAIIC